MSKQAASKTGTPAGVKVQDGGEVALSGADIRLIMEGWEVKRLIADAQTRLDAINAQLLEAHGDGCALVVAGICRASLSARKSIKVTDPARLEQVLGGRYLDLVEETQSYRAQPKLVEMATDGDEPLQPAIAACLTITPGQSVTWRAEK